VWGESFRISGWVGEFERGVQICPEMSILREGFWNQNRPRPFAYRWWGGSVKGSQLAAPRPVFCHDTQRTCHDTMPRTPRTLPRNARALSCHGTLPRDTMSYVNDCAFCLKQ